MTSNIGRMTRNMTESLDIFEEDRISHLPGDVIECIMEFLPARDAVRTCVLSSKWRYVWANHPSLVLDKGFWLDMLWRKSSHKFDIDIDYEPITSSILLCHVGHIRRFCLDVSRMSSVPHSNIGLWLSSLCRRKLKRLYLDSAYENPYKVPSWIFSTCELTHLRLYFGDIREVVGGCFTNIQILTLNFVLLGSGVLTAPLLTSLTLCQCSGSRDFDVSAPRLASLTLDENDCLNLKPFLMCSGINYAYLFSTKETEYIEDYVSRLSLVKLLAAWPGISQLIVDGLCFKYLATGSIPCTLEIDNLRYLSLCDLNLDLELIPWILCILKNSPVLHTFEIWFADINLEAVNDIVELEPIIMNFSMDQLCTIKMEGFTASRYEVIFAKILLQCAPVLEKLLIEENKYFLDPNKRILILKKLLLLQRAFPKTEIIFG